VQKTSLGRFSRLRSIATGFLPLARASRGRDKDGPNARSRRLFPKHPLSTLVLAAVLFGALLHASWNAVVKAQYDHSLAALVVAVFAGCFGFPLMLALPAPPPAAWPYLAASSLIHIGYFVLVGFAYRSADLGVAYPLTRGSAPLLTALLAFLFLSEALAWNGWLAIVILAAGIMALSADALIRGGLTWRAALAVAANAGVIVTYTLVDGLGARLTGDGLVYGAWLLVGAGLCVLLFALVTRRQAFFREAKKMWLPGLVAGALVLPSYGIALWAMTEAPIGIVAALRETSVLFAAVIGARLFGEPFGPRRWLALALIVGGIVLLKLPAA
jgi:drug/metabolite transporter (DMT)-like permease